MHANGFRVRAARVAALVWILGWLRVFVVGSGGSASAHRARAAATETGQCVLDFIGGRWGMPRPANAA